MVNKIALEFAQYVLQQNPKAKSFVAIYDAMTRAATFRSFHNLGREELAGLGISFSLLATDTLERVIDEARMALSGQNNKAAKEMRSSVAYSMGVQGASSLTLRHESPSSSSKAFGFSSEIQPEGTTVQSNDVSLLPLTIQTQEASRLTAD